MTVRQRVRIRRILAAFSAIAAIGVAVLMILPVVLPGVRTGGPLGLEPGPPTSLEHVLGLAAGLALVLVARGLWHGTRRAALIAAGAVTIIAAAGLSHGGIAVPCAELLAAGLLVAGRATFPRGTARVGIRRPAALAGVTAAAAWVLAAAALLAADRVTGMSAAARAAGGWLLNGTWWLRSAAPLALALDVLMVAALAAAGLLVVRILRPAAGHDGHTPAEHLRAAALVAEHATDSLDPFALREDKAFHFAAGGFLAYRTLRGTAVVSGDPIGPAGVAPAILASFALEATRRGWDVAMTGASARHLDGYRALGFQTLCIGEEAVVRPADFSLEGSQMKTVRKAVGRQQRRGWRIEVLAGDELDEETVTQLDHVDREWRASQPRLTGFAMTLGRLWGSAEDARSVYVTGRDPGGVIRAFVRFGVYRDGLSLDVMRRVGECPNGLTETLVVAAIEHARSLGLHAVSLNFAGFAHVMGAGRPLTRSQQALRWALTRSHDRFQLERLVTFNKKFLPAWEPRYLVHQGTLDLPIAGLRVLQAEAYVRPPRPRRLKARWEPALLPVAFAPARATLPSQ